MAKGTEGGRIYDRIHFCLFCGKADAKISRHLQTKHSTEKEVLALKELSAKEKSNKLDLLRQEGDFYHNMKILKSGGELIVVRRPGPTEFVNYKDYVPCIHCLGFLKKDEMWRHLKTCIGKSQKTSSENVKNDNLISQCEILLFSNKYGDGASKELSELILERMNKDAIFETVSKDHLIKMYGSFLLNSVAGFKKLNGISQRMRVLARLVMKIRELNNSTELTLTEILTPNMFDVVIEATKILGGFAMQNKDGELVPTFETPSLPLLIGFSIEQASSLQNGLAIRARNKDAASLAKDFLKIYKLEWSTRISSISLKNMDVNKFNKIKLLPVTDDLLKLREFLKNQIPKLTEELKGSPSLETWRSLAELAGIRLTIFNRRRGNEVFNLLLKRFKERKTYQANELEEIKKSLTPLEKRLMNR